MRVCPSASTTQKNSRPKSQRASMSALRGGLSGGGLRRRGVGGGLALPRQRADRGLRGGAEGGVVRFLVAQRVRILVVRHLLRLHRELRGVLEPLERFLADLRGVRVQPPVALLL